MRAVWTALLCAAASSACAAPAHADTITYSGIFGLSFPDYGSPGQQVQLASFDTSLGTATGITVEASGTWSGIMLTTDVTTPGYYNLVGEVSLEIPAAPYVGGPPLSNQSVYVPAGDAVESISSPSPVSASFTLPALFYEYDNTPSLAIGMDVFLQEGPIGFGQSYAVGFEGDYQEVVTYTPVPEPVSLGLLAIGLTAMFGAKFLRDKTVRC